MRKLYFSGIIVILLLTSIQQTFAQKTPVRSIEERNCVRTPATSEQISLRSNPALIEAEKERVKNNLSVAQRNSKQFEQKIPARGTSNIVTESVFLNGTLSSTDPVFNRTLPHAQGAPCPGLSAVGTATHYKTHTFTLTTSSNVTISVDPVDGGSVTPAGSDTYIALYSPAGFVPGSACTNSIAADDDGGVGLTSRLTTTTPLPAGTYTAVVTSFDNEPTDFPWNYTLAILFTSSGGCTPGNIVTDGSFETTNPGTLVNPSWPSTSTNFGSSLCDAFNCGNGGGTALPRTGTFFAWFGGTANAEVGTVEQSVVIPVGANIDLNYYLRIGSVAAPFNATLRVFVDGVVQSTITEPAVAEATYTLRTLSLSAFADGNSHTIRFQYDNPAASGTSNFTVDDVSFDVVSCGPCVAPTITTQPSNSFVCLGAVSTFTVTTAGSAPTYQWQENISGTFANISNGGVYSGATSSTLTLTGATLAMSGRQYRVVVTNGCGTITSSAGVLTLNQTTHTSATATPNSSICSPGATTITGTAGGTSAGGNLILAQSGTINLAIPDNNATGVSSVLNVPQSITSAANLKLRLNMRHSWVGDLRITLTGPCGTTLVFDRPGVPASTFGNSSNLGTSNATTPPPAAYIFDIAGATIIPEASLPTGFIPAGTYQPSDASNPGFAHNWAGLTFPCAAGNWTLTISDNGAGDLGALVDWAIFKTNLYTHTLTGPGTIVQNPPTGPNNATGNFSVTAIPAGVHTYVLTSTDGAGCSAVSNLSVTVNPTPVVTIAPAAPIICNGALQQLTATVTPPLPQLVTGGGTVTIGTSAGPANPYPSNLVVTGLPTTGVTIKSVTLNGVSHTFPSDLDILLQSPTGGNVILLSDRGGATPISNINLTFDDAAAAIAPSPLVAGTHRPTNTAVPDNFPAPGPGSISQLNPTLASLGSTSDYNGSWKLFVNDQFSFDGGSITSWSITFNIPVPVTWTAGAGGAGTIFTDPAGTTPYVAGTPTILPVYVKPTATTTATVTSYTATTTRLGCTGSATVNVTTNALPAITTQPAPATQTICPGFNVVYSVGATGTGLTYQWRKNGVNLVNGVQASGSLVSGATTNSVTLIGVVAADAGTYTVVVSGTCTPSVTSSNAVLVVAAAPTISTQPTSRTVCEGLPTTFTVAATGTPTPTIFQWQVSTNGGGTWTNLTTGGSYTTSFTIPAVTVAMSGNLYRVIVTNSCGQSTTSNNATLTVPALTPVTATALPATICLSDGPIALVGSPVGGTWSGIGVSGSNFVPSATAAGTYILTYTYTNGAGCVSTTTITAKVADAQSCGRINLLRDNAVILYPNPNDGRFNIRINSTLYGFLGMQVYSSAGQLVHRQSFTNLVFGQVIPIDLSKLPSGPYMVKFFYDGGIRTADKTFTVVIGRQ